MKLTEPQQRMLTFFGRDNSTPTWELLASSGYSASGYRVLRALCDKGLATGAGSWWNLTDIGKAERDRLTATAESD